MVKFRDDAITVGNVQVLRDGILRTLEKHRGNPVIARIAEGRLRQRLPLWFGQEVPPGANRIKNKIPRGTWAEAVVGADQAERLIVRTLAVTRKSAQFTVDTRGVIYATDADGWSRDRGSRYAVSGLSPLLDTAGRAFYESSDHRGAGSTSLRTIASLSRINVNSF